MSNIDKRALREAAEKAGSDKWQAKKISGDFYVIRNGSYEKQHGFTSYQPIAEIEHKPVRDFVAAANPATVLALLDELEAKDKQISLDFQIKARLCRESNSLHDRLREAEKRIAELEATEAVVNIKSPTIGRAYSVLNHVWTEQEVRKACELAGIKLNIAAAGKGE
ncbi:TPA: ead/Ea22-like family protein [Enterobacter hormaechei subsp. xiangfangensis]